MNFQRHMYGLTKGQMWLSFNIPAHMHMPLSFASFGQKVPPHPSLLFSFATPHSSSQFFNGGPKTSSHVSYQGLKRHELGKNGGKCLYNEEFYFILI